LTLEGYTWSQSPPIPTNLDRLCPLWTHSLLPTRRHSPHHNELQQNPDHPLTPNHHARFQSFQKTDRSVHKTEQHVWIVTGDEFSTKITKFVASPCQE